MGLPGTVIRLIRLTGLTKRFGDLTAVEGLDLSVTRGELFGFLGPNGAGKTTTIRMMVGLLRPTAGEVHIAGRDMATDSIAAKARLGYVPDEPVLYDKLSGLEFLQLAADVYRVPAERARARAAELLDVFGLSDRAGDPIGAYSRGMRRRLALVAALLHEPEVLVLDEPTSALDPKAARLIKDVLRDFCRRGGTVFMSTHILEIAEAMCSQVGIIDRGRLIAVGTLDELRALAEPGGNGRAATLEDVFLRLTGDEGTFEADEPFDTGTAP